MKAKRGQKQINKLILYEFEAEQVNGEWKFNFDMPRMKRRGQMQFWKDFVLSKKESIISPEKNDFPIFDEEFEHVFDN